jgi:hypothetical protein
MKPAEAMEALRTAVRRDLEALLAAGVRESDAGKGTTVHRLTESLASALAPLSAFDVWHGRRLALMCALRDRVATERRAAQRPYLPVRRVIRPEGPAPQTGELVLTTLSALDWQQSSAWAGMGVIHRLLHTNI